MKQAKTLGELKASGYQPKSIKGGASPKPYREIEEKRNCV